MTDTREKSQISTADESYGHVVDGVVFPPGVVSSFCSKKGGEGGAPEKKQ